ncbi:hypothetical protein PQX77_020899 [Marasmius sp. AFHP31]|nr:hypothetical protein PQX77_020899 [Marasmius sp. AFHP31]
MNRQPDLMRSGINGMALLPGMSSGGPFMPNSQQSGLPSGPNSTHPPPMGMIGGGPQSTNSRFLSQPPSMLPSGQQPRPMTLARPNGPPMNPNGGPPMNNMNMGGMNFSPNMMPGPGGQANQIRRVNSQSSMTSGMTSNTLGMGMGQGIGNTSMGMGITPGMPPNPMRQGGQPMPGQPQMPMRGHMQQPEGSMSMNRPNPAMSNQNIVRSATTPLMGSLNPPSSLPQNSITGVPPQRNDFQNPSHPPHLSSSPRPGPTANIGMAGLGSSQNSMAGRTPEANMYGGNPNFSHGGPQNNRMPNGNYPLVPSTPPNQIDMPGSLNNTPNSAANHSNFMTPAQKLGEMHSTESFGPFGLNQGQNQNGGPSHPPQPHNPNHPAHPPRPPSTHHQSPPHHDMGMNIYPARPQSQPQNNHVGRPPSSQAPRPSSLQPQSQHQTPMQQHQQPPAAPPNSAGLPQPGRIPPQNPGGSVGPTSQSLPQTGLRPSSSGGPGQLTPAGSSSTTHVGSSSQQQPLLIAPRPPPHNPQQAPQQQQQQQQQQQPSHPPGAPPVDTSPRDESSPPSATTVGPSQPLMQPGPGNGIHGPLPPYQVHMTRPGGQLPNPTAGPSSVPQISSVGQGQGLMRLLQFSGGLATEHKTQKLQLAWWNDLVREYFTPKAIMKYTLWKDNQTTEAKVFDGARERLFDYGHAVVECVSAVWTYKYNNGYTVLLKGPMTVHVVITTAQPTASGHHPHHQLGGNYHLKFENFEFEAKSHEKFIALDSIGGTRSPESPKLARLGSGRHLANGMSDSVMDQDDEEKKWDDPRVVIERGTIPSEPVNAFGIPQATMRCLELSDSCADMADLIAYSAEHELGPMDALKALGSRLRETMPHFQPGHMMMNGYMGQGMNTPTMANFPLGSGTVTMSSTTTGSPALTLCSPAPTTLTNPNPNSITPSTMASASAKSSPQNAPGSTQNSPRKQHKTIPQPSSGPSGIAPVIGSSNSVSSSTPGASSGNTPSLANATLKRKQNPETDNQPPSKRTQRKPRK